MARRAFRMAGRRLLGTITHVNTTAPVAALTFDDAPDPESTPALLDILARHNAKATFFMPGVHARRDPGVLYEADDPAAVDRKPMFAGLDLLTRGEPHKAAWFVRTDADCALHGPS